MQTKHISLTTSNFDLANLGLFPVVWLTDSYEPDNMGLLFDPNIPDEFNKTYIRITVMKQPYMKLWDKWSDEKDMDKKLKEVLIKSASADKTYKTWYVSERPITFDDILLIENIKEYEEDIYYEHGDDL